MTIALNAQRAGTNTVFNHSTTMQTIERFKLPHINTDTGMTGAEAAPAAAAPAAGSAAAAAPADGVPVGSPAGTGKCDSMHARVTCVCVSHVRAWGYMSG